MSIFKTFKDLLGSKKKTGSLSSGLSIQGKTSLSYKPTPEEDIYAHQFSCMNRKEDCSFCKKMDGAVITPDDPILKHLISDKDPDKMHPFGYRPEIFRKLCSCNPCCCMWVDILNDEERPPVPYIPSDLKDQILKMIG